MERLSWYIKRLSVMEPGEIRHRLGEQLRLRQLALRQQSEGHADVPPVRDWRRFAFCMSASPVLPPLQWDMDALRAAADGWKTGDWPALGFNWTWRDEADIWRRAPDTGRLWPQDFFGAISYRAGNPYGDIRVAWEPGRLQQLVALALLAEQGQDAEADAIARVADTQLHSWIAGNPPYRGIHYISAMECALRLIAVCHGLDLLRGRLPDPDRTWPAALELVTGHAALIERRLSLYSSRGNHTIAECAGLVYAGTLFAEHSNAVRWRKRGLEILAGEATHQVLGDGGGIERALHYHRFVIDLLGLVDALLEHRHMERPPEIVAALERGRRFLSAVTLADGETLPVGDGDGGYALSRFLRWKVDDDATVSDAEHFEETGYSVLRAAESDTVLLFDHGPLGMPPSFGHAHADALSVALYRGAEPILADPGTHTYTGDPDWRRYFRSTAAHNTVRIDTRDQAFQETAFQWSLPYECRLIGSERSDAGVVRMLGLLETPGEGGFTHLRGVAARPGVWVYVWDHVVGSEDDTAAVHWHCAVPVRKTDNPLQYLLATPGGDVSLELTGDGAAAEVITGQSDPPLGWLSSEYGRMRPCTVIRRGAPALPATFGTILIQAGVMQEGGGPRDADLSDAVSLWQRWAKDAGTN
jgi:hypothetical protein